MAELVLKCIWKLARNIPQDLTDLKLDPVELFPAIEHFLQTVPPNEWRARATNRIPCGDMPLRTVKVIIQHVVGESDLDIQVRGSFLLAQPIMVTRFMTFYRAHSTTPPPRLSTHMFTESSIQGPELPLRMGPHALTKPLSHPEPRLQVLVDPHPRQRLPQMEHLGMCDGRLRVTTPVEACRPSMALFRRQSRNRTLTLSYSRSSDISRVRQRALCTRRELQSFITS